MFCLGKYTNIFFLLISFFLYSCAGGGGSGSGTSSDPLDTESSISNTNFASGYSGTYNSTTASNWASNSEFDGILNTSSLSGRSTSQNPYEVMNVHKAYGYGLSGNGYYIHIEDNRIDQNHMEWANKTIQNHQTNYSTDINSHSSGNNWHGSAVASVALGAYNNNAKTDIMGVAYNSDLYYSDYDTLKSGYSDYAAHYAASLDGAPSKTAASNHSWGIVGTNIQTLINYKNNNNVSNAYTVATYLSAAGLSSTTSSASTWLNSLNTFQDNKGVITWALSNDSSHTEAHWLAGLPELVKSLNDAWITVGTVDISGSAGSETYTSVYSDCGSTAAYCLVTDSYNVNAASYEDSLSSGIDTDGSSSNYYTAGGLTGNSLGAPMVAGLVTLLQEAFPDLAPAQITDRLLATANNSLGVTNTSSTSFTNGVTHGYNSIYGHGIPDVYKALQPITSSMMGNSLLVGNNINKSRAYNLSSSGLNLGSSFGDSLSLGLKNEKAVFYDALYGPFKYNFSNSVNVKIHQRNKNIFEEPKKFTELKFKTNSNVKNSFAITISEINNETFLDPQNGFYYSADFNDANVIFANKMPLEYVLGFYELENDLISVEKNPFIIPFIEDAEDNFAFGTNIYSNKDTSIVLGYYNTDNNSYDKLGIVSSINFSNKDSKNSLILGYTEEENRFLNSDAYGAFNINDKNNPTNFISKKYLKKFPSNSEILLSASYGFTNVNTNKDTLINKIGPVESSSFGINFTKKDILNNKDKFSLIISQPHRVEVGTANISIPTGRDKSGNLYYKNKDISLSPSGRQLDYSLDYIYNFSNNQSIKTKASISTDYNHIKDNDLQNSLSLMYNLSF